MRGSSPGNEQMALDPVNRVPRPMTKRLPQHGRVHNRKLVLQTLHSAGTLSRADLARRTGLTRVTISDLIAEVILEGLVIETGQSEEVRPGKPATLLEIDRSAFQIVGLDLSDYATFRGGLVDLDGQIVEREQVQLNGATGAEALEKVLALCGALLSKAIAPVLGIGVGSPGIIDSDGVVEAAANLRWTDLPLQHQLSEQFGVPVVVSNDANAAMLAEFSFGETDNDMMLVKIGHGVGSSLLLGGAPLLGSRNAAGEIGHVVSGADAGLPCICGKAGCLETWVAAPRIAARLAAAGGLSAISTAGGQAVLAESGHHLGLVLAPVVAALNISEVILSGPELLLSGAFLDSAAATVRARTMAGYTGDLILRMTTLGEDIVTRGSAVMVLSRELGFS